MTAKNYLVSAIVSVYNCERFIAGCLEDLEQQTIADKVEIVVVNSGSQQNEEAIIKKFQQKFDNIVYIKTENRETLYQAWNRGIKTASGKYIANANSDDRHRKDAFEITANEMEINSDIDFVYYDFIVTETENETFENCTPIGYLNMPEYDPYTLAHRPIFGHQPMWRKTIHEEFGYFDESLKVAGDYDFWLRISEKCEPKHINQYLGLYLKNAISLERVNYELTATETVSVRSKYMKHSDLDKNLMEEIKKAQSEKLEELGGYYLKNENLFFARKAFIHSFVFDWHNSTSLKNLLITFIPKRIAGILRKAKRILLKQVFSYAKN